MRSKMHFLNSHLNKFPKNLRVFAMNRENVSIRWKGVVMVDYYRNIKPDSAKQVLKRKLYSD